MVRLKSLRPSASSRRYSTRRTLAVPLPVEALPQTKGRPPNSFT